MTVISTPATPATPSTPSVDSPAAVTTGDVSATERARATPVNTSPQALAASPPLSRSIPSGQIRPGDLEAAVTALNAVMDGFGSLLLTQQQLRQEGVARGTDAAAAGERTAESALERQREAMEAMQRAQRRARGLLRRAPRWVKKLVAGIITAAGAVAGAFTGGVAAGLAVAGAVLILAGDAVSKLLVKAGMDPEKAAWVGFAVKLVGAALSFGAGFAGGATSAATSAMAVRDGITLATRIISTANALADLGTGTAAAVFTFQASEASADADAAGLDIELANDDQQDAVEAMRDAHQTYQRVLQRMQSWLSSQQETRQALVAQLSA